MIKDQILMTEERSKTGSEKESAEPSQPDDSWYDKFLTRIGLKSKESLRENLEEALAETSDDSDFSSFERTMLRNVVDFHRLRVDDVMVPRSEITAVPRDIELGELLDVFREAGHSRLPVYDETLDNPLGMIHIRDVLNHITAISSVPNTKKHDFTKVKLTKKAHEVPIIRDVLFVPDSMSAINLLGKMQADRIHMALVIDEFGGTDGLVSIEDLVESVVGDIEDEHDEEEVFSIVKQDDGSFLVDARIDLEDLSKLVDIDLSQLSATDEVDTLGGLVAVFANDVPAVNEVIEGPNGLNFEVVEGDSRRIKMVRVIKKTPLNEANQESTAPVT